MPGGRIATAGVPTVVACLLGCASAQAFTWSRPELIQPRGTTALDAVSCPGARLCVAVDARGRILIRETFGL